MLADLGEHLLHDDELIRYEREVPCKLSRTTVALDVQNGIRSIILRSAVHKKYTESCKFRHKSGLSFFLK